MGSDGNEKRTSSRTNKYKVAAACFLSLLLYLFEMSAEMSGEHGQVYSEGAKTSTVTTNVGGGILSGGVDASHPQVVSAIQDAVENNKRLMEMLESQETVIGELTSEV
eukprot:CAMPEP_0118652962 /NCGR_PEP_ID=MMETSP0785-20121206/11589_1 /TAXON_ID=91992 /ORGANISM="Bolidomonas pacifica, Strain CCMP 1866" /LENGTH=107 /DNA_ID=CAMNT_0006545497 /DNA_START=76 /DNA_END=395 /DNA_ORIENTATION=+